MADAIHIRFDGVHSWTRPKTTRNGGYYSPHRKALAEAKMIARVLCSRHLHKCDGDHRWQLFIEIHQPDKRARDIDRMASFYLDALEGSVYKDDKQVVAMNVDKYPWTTDKDGRGVVLVDCRMLANPDA